jgi:hypothetical protein
LDAFTFFSLHQALKLHFTSNYDVIRYCGKVTNINENSFYARTDCRQFEYVAKKCDNKKIGGELCLANFMKRDDWIHKDVETIFSTYNDRKEKRKDLTKNIQDDIAFLNSIVEEKKVREFHDLFQKTKTGNKPPAMQLYFVGKLLPDTILSIDDHNAGRILESWVEFGGLDPLIKKNMFKLNKFKPFAKIIKLDIPIFF